MTVSQLGWLCGYLFMSDALPWLKSHSTAAPFIEKPIVRRLSNPRLPIAYHFLAHHPFRLGSYPENANKDFVQKSEWKSGGVLGVHLAIGTFACIRITWLPA